MIYGAVDGIVNGAELEFLGFGIGVMALSAVVNLFVSRWLLRVARETDSRALEAEGYNLRTDVWGAAGVALGLLAALATGWTVLDPIIAALIGLVMVGRRSSDLGRPASSWRELRRRVAGRGVIGGKWRATRDTGYHKSARQSPPGHIDFLQSGRRRRGEGTDPDAEGGSAQPANSTS